MALFAFDEASSLRLAELVEEKWHTLGNNSKRPDCNKSRLLYWQQITDRLNSEFCVGWKMDQVIKRWKTMKCNAKTSIAEKKRHASGTGGGAASPDLKEWELVIEKLIGGTKAVEGEEEYVETPMDGGSPAVVVQTTSGQLHPSSFEEEERAISAPPASSSASSSTPLSSHSTKRPKRDPIRRNVNVQPTENIQDLQRQVLQRQLQLLDRQAAAADAAVEAAQVQVRVLGKLERILDEGFQFAVIQPQLVEQQLAGEQEENIDE